MDLINQQIQLLMDNQSQVRIGQPSPDQSPPAIMINNSANSQMSDEAVARAAGRGIDKEGGNYQW